MHRIRHYSGVSRVGLVKYTPSPKKKRRTLRRMDACSVKLISNILTRLKLAYVPMDTSLGIEHRALLQMTATHDVLLS